MKHNRGRIALISFLLLTLLVQQWKGSALISGIGYSIVYAQETNSETGSDEGLQDTDSGSVMTEELQNPSDEQDYGRGSYSQYGEQYTSNTNQAGQKGITDIFSDEPDQGDGTLVIESSSSDVRTSAVKAPPEGSQGSMTVYIKWLDYDGTDIAPGSSSLPYSVPLTLQKMTGNDTSTARDVTAAEYSYNLTRNASRSEWTASWSSLPYREGENYTVRVASSEDYEFVTEVLAWDLSGDTARWDTTLTLQLIPPEEIKVTAELLCYPMEGKTLSSSDLPYNIPVTLYQKEDGSEELTRAEDADGNELEPVTFYRNSRYNSTTESDEYYWRGVFNNVPNKEGITYVPKADELPAYFREDSNRVTGKTKADGIKVEVVYTYIQERITIPVKVEWYLADGETLDKNSSSEVDTVTVYLDRPDGSQYGYINVSADGDGNWLNSFYNVPKLDDKAQDIAYTIRADDKGDYSCEDVIMLGGALTDGFLVKYTHIETLSYVVNKVDADSGDEVDGAVLTVVEIDAAGNEKKIDSWISAGGITHDFGTNLEPGKSYVLREEIAPTGYKKITTDIAFTVNEDGTITTGLPTVADSEGNVVYLVQNSKLKVKVSKVDVADGKEIAGARIQLFDERNQLVDEWTSSDTEVYVIENIQAGVTYTLKETIAPEGYEITSDTTFSIDEEGNITSSGTVSDEGVILIEDAKTSVKVSKVDVADGKEVAGATIQVIDSTGKVVDEWTSSDKEVHTITGLETGVTYKLKETVAPDGYTIAAETTFSLDAEGKVTSSGTVTTDGVLLVEDAKTKVKVSKIDKADGAELEGATLQILDENGDLVIGWVSGTEATEIEGLKTGVEYTLKETKAPGGYAIAAETTFTIDETGKVTTTGKTITDEEGKTILLVENQKKIENANVKISKTDIADGVELAGATIQILDENGDVVEIDGKKLEWVSGTEAKEIEGLKTGVEYTLKETVAPDGYTIASETTFSIDETGKVTSTGTVTEDGVMLVEDAKTKVKVSITDIVDGTTLEGATIQILDKDGKVVEEWISGTEAHEIEGLKTGVEYTLKETVTRDGYTITRETTFTIDETGKVTSSGTVTEEGVLLIEDPKTKVTLNIIDSNGKPVENVGFQIVDKSGKVVAKWTSGKDVYTIEGLDPGEYILQETADPSGNKKAASIAFTLEADGTVRVNGKTVDKIIMIIEKAPAENKTTPGTGNASPKTGDTNNVLLFVMMFAISACVLVGMAAKRKKG